MANRYAVVLAAGKGTRMKSKLYKVLHPVCGKPMVEHVVDQLDELQLNQLITVVGHGAEKVKEQLGSRSEYALQEEQLGTGHAVQMADPFIGNNEGTTVVVCGDTPLLTAETLKQLMQHHEKEQSAVTVLTTELENPSGYGRIVRNESNEVAKIVEDKDATDEEKQLTEINTGTYCFDNKMLFEALKNVSNSNAQGEYYLPDVLEIAKDEGKKVTAYLTPDDKETIGVNDRLALSKAEKLMQKRINEKHMKNGVTLIDPDQTYIGPDVIIEPDVVIEPGCRIQGKTTIQSDVYVGLNSEIIDCEIGEGTEIHQSVLKESKVGRQVKVGPFAHIRPESTLQDDVKVGNFVEIKKTTMGQNSKASHLSYLGDAEIGDDVNVGCGSITVNYDGKSKHKTIIEDGVFIGCNSNLVAPVTLKEGSYVAAGSTITKDIPEKALSIARARQVNKEGYVERLNKK
ncbi:bifunctional UDP-N-acetylglucosamine diphosphorylase/glucosamine-1-phosphate N-acetyltransferase GlmU [Allobacillus sp. SKP2-8]|uniref:bifunctional UDP-N-acetylglucosamine diphosphorylase/glucosamine-1-phosphate N-acetyltransferase GlmU n=1 Tax=unclassified Allobacillus TaxID=2628859 RepID=UPI0011834EBF|nr:bifunctional UDP-N-acetylglucosamine diphosphorylase/glucosamine-1-phosphate N-acetyltransferase GlmU [Allobacillus sp. SKP2-8]TSJ65423.1 bifunctional UDP-N-acetylglucosamine diphosphorylase/glucosamine-1-phosphate N-acetyltransferase GlmU [Allobacillus sp. SKP2-8]